jgi:hypothetical protein
MHCSPENMAGKCDSQTFSLDYPVGSTSVPSSGWNLASKTRRERSHYRTLGNHELMILCVYQFKERMTDSGGSVFDQWLRWGGIEADFEGFTEEHAVWIRTLPAMALVGDALLIHADAMMYVNHGTTIERVNNSFFDLMASSDLPAWEAALSSFSEHMAFSSLEHTGRKRAEQLLSLFGGELLVHGHTPIPYARQIEAEDVTEAWRYAGDRCLNVDGGMYLGSPGFVHRLQ